MDVTSWGKTAREGTRPAPRNGASPARGEGGKRKAGACGCALQVCRDMCLSRQRWGKAAASALCDRSLPAPQSTEGNDAPDPQKSPIRHSGVAPRTRALGRGKTLPHGRARTRVGAPGAGENQGRALLGPLLPKAPRERRDRPVTPHQTPGAVAGAGPPPKPLVPGTPQKLSPALSLPPPRGKPARGPS